ncbi:MAG TPA: IPT/TIG domain-containing protein [Planktothrix sp.]|jgi:hypothetical protein
MSKLAVATALSVALGLSALTQGYAQDNTNGGASSSKMQTGLPTGFSAPQTTSTSSSGPGKVPGSWQTNPTTGVGTFIPAGQQSSTTTSATTSTSSTATTSTQSSASTASQTTTVNGKKLVIPPPPSTRGGAPQAATTTTTSTKRAGSDVFTLQDSPVDVARKPGWQRFENWISLTSGQDQLTPLTLTLSNSYFTKVNISLSGRPLATEKNFKNDILTLNLAGALATGQNQLLIQAYGPVGSKITWRLSTAKPTVSGVNPKEIKIGEKFTVTGTNFSKVAASNEVWLGRKAAAVQSADGKSIVATVPPNAEPGEQNLIVRIAGMETKPFKIKIKKNPILKRLSQSFVAPGEQFTIEGEGLQGKQVDVHFGGLLAQVVSDEDTAITVVCPADAANLWNAPDQSAGPMWPVTVTVDGVPAGGEKLTIEAHNI